MAKLFAFLLCVAGLIFLVWATSTSSSADRSLQAKIDSQCTECELGFSSIKVTYQGADISNRGFANSLQKKIRQSPASQLNAEIEVFRKNSDVKTTSESEIYILQMSIINKATGNKVHEVSIEESFNTSIASKNKKPE